MKIRNSLADTFLYMLIGVTVTTILIVGYIWISQEYSRFNQSAKFLKERMLDNRKKIITTEVQEVIDFIAYKRTQTEDRLKRSIKERTYEAIAIAESLYKQLKGKRPLPEIKLIAKNALRPIRYNNGRGYFFATRMDGVEMLFADRPEMEGKNLINMKDTLGKFVIKDMIEICREKNEGFIRYTWTKPNQKGKNFPKIAFVKYFKPFDWFFGTGEYLDDVENDIKQETLARIQGLRYGPDNDGYVFAFTSNGTVITHYDTRMIGNELSEISLHNGPELVKQAVRIAGKTNGGFLEYNTHSRINGDGKPTKKISYFKASPAWDWIIASGIYADEIENAIALREQQLSSRINSSIRNSIIILSILILIVFIISRYISRRARHSFAVFSSFFDKAATDSSRIDLRQLDFGEFKTLAISANRMIDQREKIEKDLKKSNENLSKSQAIAHMGSWEWNMDSGDMYWSDEGYRLLGMSHDASGLDFQFYLNRIHHDDRDSVEQAINDALEKGTPVDLQHRIFKADGSERIHHTLAEVTKGRDGKPSGMIGIAWDITEYKSAEESLKEHREEMARLSMAVEQAAELIIITDENGIIQYVNPAFEQCTGYSRKEVTGQKPSILKSGLHDNNYYKKIWDTITGGQVWQGNFTNKKKNGSLYIEEAAISPIRDGSGQIINYVAVKRDVTREKDMETQLIQMQKMDAIGTLAGGVAHDFNNILSAIIGYSEIALYDVNENSDAAENINHVLTASLRAKDLVNQILSFSRIGEEKRGPVQLSNVILESIKLIRASLPTSIVIHKDIKAEDEHILGDSTRLQQVLINLCTNAAHAMNNSGALEISLENVYLDESEASVFPDLLPGHHVKLTVSDSGTGMEQETLERIFDPYFTTKEKGKGTGLGLTTVHGIVRGHNGAIHVKSETGQGTTFELYFPALETAVPAPAAETAAGLPKAREKAHLMLVDDESMLTDMGRQMVRILGYRVTTCNDPREALEIFRAIPGDFDLLITDMTMPYMTGDKLVREFRSVRPDLPIILCTGFSENMSPEKAAELGVNHFLLKPLTLRQLGTTIHDVLENKNPGN